MINGKRIDAVCVALGDDIQICWAPLYSSIYGGDKVEVENNDSMGTVLFSETIDIGGKEYAAILQSHGYPHKIIKRIDYTDLSWNGYEEEDDE